MLGFLFGFNARLGRLYYLLYTIALAVVLTAVCFAIAVLAFQFRGGMAAPAGLTTGPVIAVGVVFGWMTFTLQSMRIRDIGWDPVCVVPIWIASAIVDRLVAVKFPAWAIGHENYGTAVGALINLAMMAALLILPSGEYGSPVSGETRGAPDRPSPRTDGAAVAAERIARVTGTEFGRRGY